ncbi:Cro/CI family transcriptional regulator [Raoultella ornithinolytica]|uniref:Cro/CI family transcriptional regulator n=1 Tax=Raoultella ornithinolytica TaxID=54291 RepID=UPI0013F455B7|nr:Cro/CI family transcriptional regulator [Raoultella ornithinolytica]QIJ49917.1 transcriptional regulator [Raoultella ornithinolytica]
MFKSDAIKFYGTRVKVARAAGVDPSAVSQWGELVPEKNAARLQEDSGGALIYDQSVYDQYRNEKRSGEVNHENQA